MWRTVTGEAEQMEWREEGEIKSLIVTEHFLVYPLAVTSLYV